MTASSLPRWLDRDRYPFVPASFEGPYGRSSYLDEGRRDAPPVLLLHGLPTWSYLWRALVPRLARHHRVVAPDHLGFGLSDAPDPARFPYRIAHHSEQLAALVDHLALEDVTLVAHDFGGPIGLPLALEGDRIRRLVLTNTFLWRDDRFAVKAVGAVIGSPVGRWFYRRLNAAARFEMRLVSARPLDRADHGQYLHAQAERRRRHATWMLARELTEAGDRLAGLWERRTRLAEHPTLLLWGLKDPLVGRDALRRWQQALPSATTVTYPDAGHFTAEEVGGPLADPILTFTGHPPKAAAAGWPEQELDPRGARSGARDPETGSAAAHAAGGARANGGATPGARKDPSR